MTEVEAAQEQETEQKGGFGSLGSIIWLLVLTWAAGIASRPLNDNSFLTHLATGRLILEEGRVPSRDPYTFTALGEPWTVQSWLASVAYAGFERLGGAVGLRLLIILVYLLAAALLWRLTRPAGSLLVRVALIAGALFVATGLWTERPYMVGVIGVALVLLALDGEFPWWGLLPLMWVWGNSHGSFVFAIVLVALVVLGGALDRGRRWRAVPEDERRVALAVVAGTVLAAAGPLGLRVLTFPFTAADRSDIFQEVIEWQAPTFRSTSELSFLLFALVAVLALARWAREWCLILPAVAFLGASLYSQRNIVLATVVLVAAFAKVVPGVGTLRGDDRPGLGRPMGVLIGVLFVLVSANTLLTPPNAVEDYAARPVAWLRSAGLDDVRVATDVPEGNFLQALDGATGEVFIDDRFDMMPPDVFDDYLTLLRSGPRWEDVLDEHDIDVVVWRRSLPTSSLLATSADWRVGFSDATWMVAVRR